MSPIDGQQAFAELRRIRSDVAVILRSGYNEQDATRRFAGHGLADFAQKPYGMAELRRKLTDTLPDNESGRWSLETQRQHRCRTDGRTL